MACLLKLLYNHLLVHFLGLSMTMELFLECKTFVLNDVPQAMFVTNTYHFLSAVTVRRGGPAGVQTLLPDTWFYHSEEEVHGIAGMYSTLPCVLP